MNPAVADFVSAVADAFRTAPLPMRRFVDEPDMGKALLPSMKNALASTGIEIISNGIRTVPCFIPGETRKPDGEARRGDLAIALELKLLKGDRSDGGSFHRGFGQCFTYVAAPIFSAALLLVVHQCPQRALSIPSEMLGLRMDPFRSVIIADRCHYPPP